MSIENTYKHSIASMLPDHSSDNENFNSDETPLERANFSYSEHQKQLNA